MVSEAMQQPKQYIFTFDAIGSRFWFEDLTGKRLPMRIQKLVQGYADEFDNNYSRFKLDSLVSKLAVSGVLHSPPSELLDMLDISKQMYDVTDGVFNITVGATLSNLGYGSTHVGDRLLTSPWDLVVWNKDMVRVPKGVVLDFGGLGKGWLIDKIAELLRQNGIERFIVNGGGDLYIQNTEPVSFALENPLESGKALQTVHIQQGALAGSSTVKRSWAAGGGTKHHIINPATGDSSDSGVLASFVLADTALIADCLATVLIVAPSLKDRLERHFGSTSMLVQQAR